MPAIDENLARRSVFDGLTSGMSSQENALLFSTLALVTVAFVASSYTTARTLVPLLPPHPLRRRSPAIGLGSFAKKKLRLKSAQRFTVWLAGVDLAAAVILVWEGAIAASTGYGLGGTKSGASRLYVSCTARPTLLLVVALLSYVNVIQGRSIALGKLDWIVWVPAFCILGLGASLAGTPSTTSPNVWTGLIVWESTVTAIVTLCFGRLLISIIRVRKWSRASDAQQSTWTKEHRKGMSESGTPYRMPPSFLPPIHSNFSGLSTSFISTIGTANKSASSLNSDMPGDILTFSASHAPSVSYVPRTSTSMDVHSRDFRSPTPGSTHGLLANAYAGEVYSPGLSANSFTPKANGTYQESVGTTVGREVISFEDLPRPSVDTYSSGSTGGLIGARTMRQAISQDVWGTMGPPGSGGISTRVELSHKEARGAVIRLGGHLASCLMGHALSCPFLVMRHTHPAVVPPLSTSILLVVAVTQSAVVLAIQCGLSEGFWFRHDAPPVLTSSSAVALGEEPNMVQTRPASAASSFRCANRRSDSVPGIPTSSIDCDETVKGRFGRAFSMTAPHPKLHVLQSHDESVTTSVTRKMSSLSGHVRLRSLTLSKSSLSSFNKHGGDCGRGRDLSESVASRSRFVEEFPRRHHRSSTSPIVPPLTKDATTTSKSSIGLMSLFTREVSLGLDSPSVPEPVHSPTSVSASVSTSEKPRDFGIDFLSSKVLPRLVPTVKIGKGTVVGPESEPLPGPPTFSEPTKNESMSSRVSSFKFGSIGSKKSKNHKNLSLAAFGSKDANVDLNTDQVVIAFDVEPIDSNDVWIEVSELRSNEEVREVQPKSPFLEISASLREEDRKLSRDASKTPTTALNRSSKAWARREALERAARQQAGDADDEGGEEDDDDDNEGSRQQQRRRPPGDIELVDADATEMLEERRPWTATIQHQEDEEEQKLFDEHVRRINRLSSSSNKLRRSSVVSTSSSSSGRSAVLDRVVHHGSKVIESTLTLSSDIEREEDDEDSLIDEEHVTIQCATVRPISRSVMSRDPLSPSLYSLSMTSPVEEDPPQPVSRERTLVEGGITSQGFRNMLTSNSWHSSDTEADESNVVPSIRSSDRSNTSITTTSSSQRGRGLRPLSLLGQRDPNAPFDYSDYSGSEGERSFRKTTTNGIDSIVSRWQSKAKPARSSGHHHRRSSSNSSAVSVSSRSEAESVTQTYSTTTAASKDPTVVKGTVPGTMRRISIPLPLLPLDVPTIEEDVNEDDKRSGSPTPRATRRRTPAKDDLLSTTLSSTNIAETMTTTMTATRTTKADDWVNTGRRRHTTRSVSREIAAASSSSSSSAAPVRRDENVAPPSSSSSRDGDSNLVQERKLVNVQTGMGKERGRMLRGMR